MQLRQILMLAALSCVAGFSGAGEIADSTGPVRAKRALVVPDAVTVETVKEIVTTIYTDNSTVLSTPIPQGYEEVTFQTGPHRGASPSYAEVSYGYQIMTGGCDDNGCVGISLDPLVCNGDYSHRIVEIRTGFVYGVPESVSGYYTCEPYGTVTKLVKKGAPAQTATLSLTDINIFAAAGTIGVNTSGATPICKAKGYSDFLPGTLTYWYKGGGCPGGYITQYRGSGWVTDTACYNNVLTGMQCYK